MNGRILVTGAAGFIGTNLCLALLRDGKNVLGLDDFSSGLYDNIIKINELKNTYTGNFQFIRADVVDLPTLNDIYNIYHLACPASPKFYQLDPIHTMEICFNGTLNICKLAEKNKATVLLTSTSEVYGDPHISPQVETYRGNVNSMGDRSCYDEGKRIAESIIYEYNKKHPGMYKVVRIFNTYGPYMRPDDGRFISNFINQIMNELPCTICGDGSQTRSICYVDDTVRGLVAMMNSNEVGPVNIGNPNEMSVLEWANIISKKMTTTNNYIYIQRPMDDPMQRCPDITKARELLQWEPIVGYEEGIDRTIKYFIENEEFNR